MSPAIVRFRSSLSSRPSRTAAFDPLTTRIAFKDVSVIERQLPIRLLPVARPSLRVLCFERVREDNSRLVACDRLGFVTYFSTAASNLELT